MGKKTSPKNQEINQSQQQEFTNSKKISSHYEADILKTIHELEVHKVELEMQNEELLAARKVMHQLEVHRVELEMQNEDLLCARNALDLASRKYLELFDFAPTGYLVLSEDGVIVDINFAASQMLLRFRENLYNRKFALFIQSGYKTLFDLFLKKLFTSKNRNECELYLEGGELEPLYVHIAGKVSDVSDQCLISMTDMTEHMEAVLSLKRSEVKFRNLIMSSSDAMAVQVDGQLVLVNDKCVELVSASSAEEIVGRHVMDFIAEEHHDVVRRKIVEAKLNDQESLVIQASLAKLDDTVVEVEVKAMPIEFEEKSGMQLIIRDISAQNKAILALKYSEEKHRMLVENSHDIIYTMSYDGVLIFVSDAWTRLLGHSKEQVVGQSFVQFVHPDDIPKCSEFIQSLINSKERQSGIEYRVQHIDGRWIWHTSSAVPLVDEKGNAVSFEGIAKDITHRKRVESEILETNTLLSQTNLEKDKLFAVIAHDLRSPFHVLLNLAEQMSSETEGYSITEYNDSCKILYESIKTTYQLLNNLLEWAQLQNGSMNFEMEKIQLSELVTKSIGDVALMAANKEIHTFNSVDKAIEVFADERMINSVLRNLLSNAYKFTEGGGVVTVKSKLNDAGMIEISVTDTGIGIPEDIIKKLFVLGERVSRKGTADEPSTGIGLILCKDFVVKNGGEIRVKSEIGKGSTFSFTLHIYKNE